MKTEKILTIMQVLTWIVFVGLCIQAGTALTLTVLSFFNPEVALGSISGFDLMELFNSNFQNYLYVMSFVIVISLQKCYLFYLVIKIFAKINLKQPFSLTMVSLIQKMGHICLGIGIVTLIGVRYVKWLTHRGTEINISNSWAGEEYLFFAGILYIIGLVFKRGLEMQAENELTI